MRIMLWSLLALNGVAALLWMAGVIVPAASPQAVPPPTLTAKRLELLSELPSPPARLATHEDALPSSFASPDAPLPAPPQDALPGETGDVRGPAIASASSDTAVGEAAASNGASGSSQTDGAVPVTESVPQPQQSISAALPASESAPAGVSGQPESAKVSPPAGAQGAVAQSAAAPTSESCFRTAEFAPDARERVEAALSAAGFEKVELLSSVRPRYWVYWSGAPSAATGVEQALKTAGVRDWYRVGGAREATISLGVYGQAEGAQRRQSQLAAIWIPCLVAAISSNSPR